MLPQKRDAWSMAVQDPTFHERVLDLANLVLVCVAGPEAQQSMAAAVDPDRDQVLLQACDNSYPAWDVSKCSNISFLQACSPV